MRAAGRPLAISLVSAQYSIFPTVSNFGAATESAADKSETHENWAVLKPNCEMTGLGLSLFFLVVLASGAIEDEMKAIQARYAARVSQPGADYADAARIMQEEIHAATEKFQTQVLAHVPSLLFFFFSRPSDQGALGRG
jgi:hypothetical protein